MRNIDFIKRLKIFAGISCGVNVGKADAQIFKGK